MSDEPDAEVEASPAGMMLLPPKEGHCRICAVKHEPNQPHDATSLFFGMRFKMRYKREGTWADAFAHLEISRDDAKALVERFGGKWTDPPEGEEPIAEYIDG